ncbi:MAG TPA: hypothetical protein PLV58_05085 [Campylobacterales bacterium]|nr:hypothetical protein [Campylobacterales bacterium]
MKKTFLFYMALFCSANMLASDARLVYLNPSLTPFLKDGNKLEIGVQYFTKPKFHFDGSVGKEAVNTTSKGGNFTRLPIYFLSQKIADFRFGFSKATSLDYFVYNEWENDTIKRTAQQYSLFPEEYALSLMYRPAQNLSLATTLRYATFEGRYEYARAGAYDNSLSGDGDSFGYGVSATYFPVKYLALFANYRSKVDFTLVGVANGNLKGSAFNEEHVSIKASRPAVAEFGTAFFTNSASLQLLYRKMFYSIYQQTNFEYTNQTLESAFGKTTPKSWRDINVYSIYASYKPIKSTKLGVGYAMTQGPIPDKTFSFENPHVGYNTISATIDHILDEKNEVGFTYSNTRYNKESISGNDLGINGTIDNGQSQLFQFFYTYKF